MNAPRFTIAESLRIPGSLHYARGEDSLSLCGKVVHRHHAVVGQVTCRECIAHKDLIEAAYQSAMSDKL